MTDEFHGKERREFLRYTHQEPVRYSVVNLKKDKTAVSKIIDGVSKNLSASGILFTSKKAPDLPSIVILDLDYRTTRICQEIEEKALIVKDRLLGKVVRIEDKEGGLYDVGVAFIKKSDTLPKNILNLIK